MLVRPWDFPTGKVRVASNPAVSLSPSQPLADWSQRPARDAECPACGSGGTKPFVLTVYPSWVGTDRLDLHSCPACASKFFPDFEYPEYGTTLYGPGAIKFYVEAGAGVDQLVAPLFAAPASRGGRYLDVGCGFGFAPDFARHMLAMDAIGVDPSQFAAAGSEGLGVPIIQDYLTPELDLGTEPFALAVASEVVEHIKNPCAFIKLIRDRLSEDGALILTTPDADSVDPQTPPSMLALLLSPTLHYTLFSATRLEQALREAGFREVKVVKRSHTLVAVASPGNVPVDPSAAIDRGLFERYLDQRRKSVQADSWLAHGLTYRLLKELTNTGQYAKATAAFGDLRGSVARVYDMDLDAPDTLARNFSGADSFELFAHKYPMNLGGIAYFRGIIALNAAGKPAVASRYFDLAARYGSELRAQLARIGCDDGETEEFVELSRWLSLRARAYASPRDVSAEALALVAGLDAKAGASGRWAREGVADLLQHLVNLGALEAAEPLAAVVSKFVKEAASEGGSSCSPKLRHGVCRALGLLSLNRHKAPREAAAQLLLAERSARQWRAKEPSSVEALHGLWRVRYERLLALVVGADARRALRAAEKFRIAGAEGHGIPPDVMREAGKLVRQLATPRSANPDP